MSIFDKLKRGFRKIFPKPSEIVKRGGRTHTVVKGETLSHIALQYYGNAMNYDRIFEANRDILNDPDKIQVGQVLRIPE